MVAEAKLKTDGSFMFLNFTFILSQVSIEGRKNSQGNCNGSIWNTA